MVRMGLRVRTIMEKETIHWSNMANNFTQNWVETGTKMWQSWFDLVTVTPTKAVANSFKDSVASAKPEFKYIAQRLVDNQELLSRLYKLSYKAWQDILPKYDQGESWQKLAQGYSEQMRQQIQEYTTGTFTASSDVAKLWQLYLQETQKFSQLWLEAIGSSAGPISRTFTGTPQPWLELNNLYWNFLYEQSFGSLMRTPILGPTRELNGKLLKSFDAWSNLYRSSIDYQVVLADVQVRSFEELMLQLIDMAEKGERITSWRDFQQQWSIVSDRVFEETFCDEDNLRIRGNFVNSLNTYKLYQQELVELWMKQLNMPVRSEVDEIHKNMYELRKEVKQLKKRLAKYESVAQQHH